MSMNELERVSSKIDELTKEIQNESEAKFFGDAWPKVKESKMEERRELLRQLKQLKDEQRRTNS